MNHIPQQLYHNIKTDLAKVWDLKRGGSHYLGNRDVIEGEYLLLYPTPLYLIAFL